MVWSAVMEVCGGWRKKGEDCVMKSRVWAAVLDGSPAPHEVCANTIVRSFSCAICWRSFLAMWVMWVRDVEVPATG